MKERTKNQKGITLIALIITIVVLLILAAVAINSITNEGILSQAGSTANQYNQSVKDEESFLQDHEDMLTAANGGYRTYSLGEQIDLTVEGVTHSFYVIEDKTSLGKVVLLAKQNIITNKNNTNYLTQSSSAGTVAFSKDKYWTRSGDIKEETFPVPESHIAAKAAYDYGTKIGGKGRLMIYKEANDLSKTDFSTKLYETNFWLGTASYDTDVWNVIGDWDELSFDAFECSSLIYYGPGFAGWGVRPVIEISKSKIQ